MSENTLASSELDLDAWLAGGSRNTQIVTLYARNDLHAEILELEGKVLPEEDTNEPAEDASLGESGEVRAHNKAIEDKLEVLWAELDKSRKEFRVAGRTTEEIQAIEKQVAIDFKDELDEAAKEGREVGRRRAAQLDVTIPAEKNSLIRADALAAMNRITSFEVGVYSIAESTTVNIGGSFHPVSREQVRSLYRTLGEPMADMLARAASRTANEAPEVIVPKS